jgi:hypothetical protein
VRGRGSFSIAEFEFIFGFVNADEKVYGWCVQGPLHITCEPQRKLRITLRHRFFSLLKIFLY